MLLVVRRRRQQRRPRHERLRETAERGWDEARTRAAGLMEEMEERPVQSALVIFGVGVLLGLLVGRR